MSSTSIHNFHRMKLLPARGNMSSQKGIRNPFVCCFVLYQLTSARLVSTDRTSQRKTPQINPNPYEIQDRQPRYWPRYSGSRNVRLLDGVWNVGFLESENFVELTGRFDSMDPNLDISQIKTTKKATIPSTIEVLVDPEHGYLPGYMGYRGVAFFRTTFETNQAVVRPRSESLTEILNFFGRPFLMKLQHLRHLLSTGHGGI